MDSLSEKQAPKHLTPRPRVCKTATHSIHQDAGVAQSAEQRFCKPQVGGSIPLASSTLRLFVQTAHWSKTLFTIPARHRRLPALHSTHHTTPRSPAAGARPSGMISRSGTNALFQSLLAFLVHEETADEDGQHNGCEHEQCTVHGVRLPFIP